MVAGAVSMLDFIGILLLSLSFRMGSCGAFCTSMSGDGDGDGGGRGGGGGGGGEGWGGGGGGGGGGGDGHTVRRFSLYLLFFCFNGLPL